MSSKIKSFLLTTVTAGSLLCSSLASADAMEWLMQMSDAAKSTDYKGHFVYINEGKVEAMQVARRNRDDKIEERVYSLNGEVREIIRNNEHVWCLIPEKNMGVHDFRNSPSNFLPEIFSGDISQLSQFYTFIEGSEERVAGRLAQEIQVKPRDKMRYGLKLWADKTTGLLLRSQLLDDTHIIETNEFVTIDLDNPVADEDLISQVDDTGLTWIGASESDSNDLDHQPLEVQWHLAEMPIGYELSSHTRTLSPMDQAAVEHLVITDGLSTVSVFIKPLPKNQNPMTGMMKMGAMHSFHSILEEHSVTVIGEAPVLLVRTVAEKVAPIKG